MTPEQYLMSLIAGMEMNSEIPVQLSELKLLLKLTQDYNKKRDAELQIYKRTQQVYNFHPTNL